MKKKKTTLRKSKLLLIILLIMYVLLQVIIQASVRIPSIAVFRGVLNSFQFGIGLLILYANLRHGRKLATALLGISVIFMALAILHGSNDAIPGLFNGFFYLITINIIASYDARIKRESRTDSITGIANRKGLYRSLQDKIYKNNDFSLIYLTLDNYKVINNSYGHAYGDELLRQMSKRIEALFDKHCIISRIDGAEYVVAIDGNNNVQETADKMLESVREKLTISVDDTSIDCYIDGFAGISRFPEDATDYEALIKYADIALMEAMSSKSKQACIFNTKMIENINRQEQLRKLIKEGLANDYFYLMFQPQFELNNKKLRGFETLIRMKTPDGVVISPGEFIPTAEKSDLILQIDDYVLSKAMREFQDILKLDSNLSLSINVSAKTFVEADFVGKIKNVLQGTQFPASNLEIEVTEYCLVNSLETAADNITQLHSLGIKVALDDFGTGYTSLNYVAALPIDVLKIDKTLVDDIENDPKRREFIRAVITMGQLMECAIVAEGAENTDQIKCLREDRCEYVQGFVWGRPLMLSDAKSLVK